MKTKTLLFMTSVATAGSLFAAVPEVKSVTMAQDSATREVTITYELENAPAVITLDITTNGVSIGGENIQNFSADSEVWKRVETNGTYTIKWHPDLSWPDHKITLEQGGVKAVVTAWALDNTPDYMVVDISDAATKDSNKRYYPGEEFLPGGLLSNPDYRLTSIVMRKIMAKNVTWTMGSLAVETGRNANREATHHVTLDNNYYIGVFEVTQAQWLHIVGYNNSRYQVEGTMRPVDSICYNEIRTCKDGTTASTSYYWPNEPYSDCFLGKLKTKTGVYFDMPTEAQWEFACRAGNGSGYWGNGKPILNTDTDSNLPGRYRANSGSTGGDLPSDSDVTKATAIVGTNGKNNWGLYDTNGNVAEWCLDWLEDNISSFNGEVNIDKANPVNTLSHVAGVGHPVRGGGYSATAPNTRPAYRSRESGGTRYPTIGLRLCCPVDLQ